jgi:ParB/RepB/Spo0J family partition protein
MTPPKIEIVKISSLTPFDGNPRFTKDEDLEKLKVSLQEFGWTNPVLVQKDTMMVLAGHQRLKAAKLAGITEVPVLFLDLDDVKARAYIIADNKTASLSTWNNDDLKSMMDELKEDGFDLTKTGFTEAELKSLDSYSLPVTFEEEKENDSSEPKECPNCGHILN